MNRRILMAVAVKDLREVRKNRVAVLGAVVLTIIFSVVLPLIFAGTTEAFAGNTTGQSNGVESLILTPEIQAIVDGLEPDQVPVVLFLGYLLAPLFLVIPLMIASIIAAESFVGEKERKTLEALLYTPATDLELFMGKVIAAFIPAVLFAWINFAIYTVTVNAAGWAVMHRIWFPTDVWWVLMFWVAPTIALMGIAATVLISTRVSTFMEAYQASGALVLIVVVLMMGQVFGLLFLSPQVLFLVGAGILILDIVLIRIGVGLFNRSDLIARI
jgi:ABC-2 type transport system permease protein